MLHIEYAVHLPGHGQAFYLRSMVDLRKHDHYSEWCLFDTFVVYRQLLHGALFSLDNELLVLQNDKKKDKPPPAHFVFVESISTSVEAAEDWKPSM